MNDRAYEDYFRTAVHEAGHALLCIQLGRLLPRVTIIPDFQVGYWGAVDTWEEERLLDEELQTTEEHAAALELLGGAAAKVLLGLASWAQPRDEWASYLGKVKEIRGEHTFPSIEALQNDAQATLQKRRGALLRIVWALLRFGMLADDTFIQALSDDSYYPRIFGALTPAPLWTSLESREIDEFVDSYRQVVASPLKA